MSQQTATIDTLEPTEVARLLKAGEALLIDVREPAEYATERIPGALLYPLSTFNARLLPPDGAQRLVFHCAGGKRSQAAAEHRVAAGSAHAAHLGGGLAAWKTAGLPIITPGK